MSRTHASRTLERMREATGRPGAVADGLPLGLALNILRTRAAELVRGYLRLRGAVFVGRGVTLRGKRSLVVGSWVSIGSYSNIDGYASNEVRLGSGSRLGSNCVVTVTSHVSRLGKGFSLGTRSGLGDHCHVGASGGVEIGDDVICGPYVSFHSQEHIFADAAVPVRQQGVTEAGIVIGDGCWLGARVTILDGTVIGENSVVAAGAVVKGNFPPGSLIAGIPARVLRSRT